MPNLSKQQDILAPDSFSLPPASFHPLELERVLRSFDSLIDKMSHDLNGPLATISGLVQLAQMSDDVEEVRMHLSRIHQVSSKLSGLLGELVELSSLHGSESNPRMIDVAESIEDAVAALSEWPEAKTTQLIVEATPCRVLLDGARLRSIVQHLVSNALLHHDSTKSEKWVKVIVEKEDDFLSIQVNDNGKGMSKAFLARAFDLFAKENPHSKGSGLGLFLANKAIYTMGGSMEIDSVPGQGTSISLRFPVQGYS